MKLVRSRSMGVSLGIGIGAGSVWSILKGAAFGLQSDWTRPADHLYSTQPTVTGLSGANWAGTGLGPYTHTVGDTTALATGNVLVVGNVYCITYTVSGCTGGSVTPKAGATSGVTRSADGTYTDTITCATNQVLSFVPSSDFNGAVTVLSVENVSVVEAYVKGKGAWAGSKFEQNAAANMPHLDGGALRFDGVNDYMPHTGPAAKLHTSKGFTTAFVLEPEITTETGLRTILDQTDGSPSNAGIQVVYDAANQQLKTRVSNGSGAWQAEGSTWLSRGIPHIVDARWDAASGLNLVVDDHSIEVVGGVGSLADTAALQLGRRAGGEYYSGRVSDLVVREGRVPEKDIERWRGKMRGKHSFAGKERYDGLYFSCPLQSVSWTMNSENCDVRVHWGDGTFNDYELRGGATTFSHTYEKARNHVIRTEWIRVGARVSHIGLANLQLTGPPPSISSIPNLWFMYANANAFTGTIPPLSSDGIRNVILYYNLLCGDIPSPTNAPNLLQIRVFNNRLTGYEGGVFGIYCTIFEAHNNLLPQSAVDQIIQDFHTNLSNRPKTGTLNVGGTGNAAPSPAAKALAQDIRDHGWTVTHNE